MISQTCWLVEIDVFFLRGRIFNSTYRKEFSDLEKHLLRQYRENSQGGSTQSLEESQRHRFHDRWKFRIQGWTWQPLLLC